MSDSFAAFSDTVIAPSRAPFAITPRATGAQPGSPKAN